MCQDINKPVVVSSFFYAALDEDNGKLEPVLSKGKLNAVQGHHSELGDFKLSFSSAGAESSKQHYLVSHSPQV